METPDKLRPYLHHGVDLRWRMGDKNALGQCPFCLRESKFSVDIVTGQFRCLGCNEGTDKGKNFRGGNATVFIQLLWEKSFDATQVADYKELAKDRRLHFTETLIKWEVAKSITTGEWLVPGYNVERKLTSLYRYALMDGRRKLLATPTLGHKLHGANLYSYDKPEVYVCEGPWDGMALWEVMSVSKEVDGTLAQTANQDLSLAGRSNVLAVPGCGVFFDSWLPLFTGKRVYLMYDNDHERVHPVTGLPIAPGGLQGMERVAKLLTAAPNSPEQVSFLKWGEQGWNPDLPHGYDLRDKLTKR